MRPAARSFQALLTVGLGEAQEPQACPVALLGVRLVVELPLHDSARARPIFSPQFSCSARRSTGRTSLLTVSVSE